MNAPPFPTNPNVGDWFGGWAWNGVRWVASPTTGLRLVTQVFTQSGAYMPSPGLVSLTVECIGGGGAGGSAGPPALPNVINGGGGGGSGGRSVKTLPAALVRGGVLVTVGGGGEADIAGNVTSGEPTSFGAFCVANGGGFGSPNDGINIWGTGGSGATPGIGDVTFPGAAGEAGAEDILTAGNNMAVQGALGGTIFGGNVGALVAPGTAVSGGDAYPNTGAGGMGAVQNQVPVGTPEWSGSNGGSGICIITEYCWGDTDQPQPEWRPPLDVNVKFPRPPWPGGGPWPPGSWWPPGPWWGSGPWRGPGSGPWQGPGPGPWSPSLGPLPRDAVEFEADQSYDQSINPETGRPWEDDR